MSRNWVGTLIKLAVVSLLVGFVLVQLEITPEGALNGIANAATYLMEQGVQFFSWAWQYIVVGAAVVIPLWLLRLAWRARKRG